jgi:hypothetical protein
MLAQAPRWEDSDQRLQEAQLLPGPTWRLSHLAVGLPAQHRRPRARARGKRPGFGEAGRRGRVGADGGLQPREVEIGDVGVAWAWASLS